RRWISMASAARPCCAIFNARRHCEGGAERVGKAGRAAETRLAHRGGRERGKASCANPENRQFGHPQRQWTTLVPWLQHLDRSGGQRADAGAAEEIQGQTVRHRAHAPAVRSDYDAIWRHALSHRHRDAERKVLSGRTAVSAGDQRGEGDADLSRAEIGRRSLTLRTSPSLNPPAP